MKNRGFTLLELLVVIAIIGLLSTFAVVALENAKKEGRDARRIADFKQIQKALQLYYDDHGQYPHNPGIQNETSFNDPNWIPNLVADGYLGKLPVDPVNTGNVNSGEVYYAAGVYNSLPYPPWIPNSNNYTYQYTSWSNEGQNNQEYNLIGQLEKSNHPLKCEFQCWTVNTYNRNAPLPFRGDPWCNSTCGGTKNFDVDLFSDYKMGGL